MKNVGSKLNLFQNIILEKVKCWLSLNVKFMHNKKKKSSVFKVYLDNLTKCINIYKCFFLKLVLYFFTGPAIVD